MAATLLYSTRKRLKYFQDLLPQTLPVSCTGTRVLMLLASHKFVLPPCCYHWWKES